VSILIAEQSKVCPYIALCHTPNTSSWDENNHSPPCCKKCSCKDTCVKEGSCCPDYLTEEDLFSSENDKPVIADANTTVTHTLECVKVQHSSNHDQGYMMVASCPSDFNDIEVKQKCEMKKHFSNLFDIFEHAPVTYTDQGQTYKNQYCGKCIMQKDVFSLFWHVSLMCRFRYFTLQSISADYIFEFVETALFNSSMKCNIVYKYEGTNTNLTVAPQMCKYSTIIDTCSEKTSTVSFKQYVINISGLLM
jgi:hypothetical protein